MPEVQQPILVLGGRYTLEVKDRLSGAFLEFHYRLPIQAERDAYTKATVQHKGNKVRSKANVFTEQADLGKRVLTGFKKGPLADESGRIISSDKTDPDFNPDWKDLLEKYRPDLLAAVGQRVLKTTESAEEEDLFEVVEDFGVDPSKPLSDDTLKVAEDQTDPSSSA